MPKSKHLLRLIRAATPYATQSKFAAFLGVPVSALQAVESGKARLTRRLALRIRDLTGADEVELLRGAGGEALTIAGKRYMPQAFAAWTGSPQQLEERAKRETVKRTQKAQWLQFLNEAAPDARPDCLSAEQLTAVEDLLVPWQTCEFASAEVAAWKQMPAEQCRQTGWSHALHLPPRARLTLSVQSAPVWNPDTAPPGSSAVNEELFPPCYFTVAAGSAGSRLAADFWRAVCREHAIRPEDGTPLRGVPTGSWRGFFRHQGRRYEPHAVFAGIRANKKSGLQDGLFPAGGILRRKAGEDPAARVLQFMQEHSEDAGSPAGILLFVSLDDQRDSLLGSLLMANLRATFPTVPIMVAGMLPSPGIKQPGTAPWHIALAMQAIRRHASAALLFSSERLITRATRTWKMAVPGSTEINLLTVEALASLTAPLRFGGHDSPPVDLASIIACFPAADAMPLITGQSWPLAALTDRRLKTITLPWLARSLLKAAVREKFLDPVPASSALFLRVRTLPSPELVTSDDPPTVRLTGRTSPGMHESATLFAPSPAIRRTLRRFAKQARAILDPGAVQRFCQEAGVTEQELRTAIAGMAQME